jgi:tetratricopeptide (TPR) repeat protein
MSEEITPPRAVPTPPSEAPAPDTRAFGELRKELQEARNLIIKTDSLLKNLHAELRQMGRKQEQFEKSHKLTSVAAYVLFATIAVIGAFSFAKSEIRGAREESIANEARVKQLTQDLEKVKAVQDARRDASEKAVRVYDLLASEKEGPGLNQAMSQAIHLDRQLITPLESKAIDDRAAGMKAKVAIGALDRGSSAFRRNDYQTAAQELSRYLELVGKAEDGMTYFRLGNALSQMKEWQKAISPLEAFLKSTGGTKTAQYAGYLLGTAYEETGAMDKARQALERAAGLYPGSEFAPMIRTRLRRLNAAAGQTGPAAAPAPPAAPPTQAASVGR